MRKMNKFLSSSKRFFKKNGSTILTVVGGVGVIGTAVLAAKATPKAMLLLNSAENEKGEELTNFEKVKVAGPAYIPAVITGAATIVCIFGANALNKKQQAALTSAYALLDNSYKEYKKKVQDMYGGEAANQIKAELAKDKYEKGNIEIGEDEILFYDEFSERYFTASPTKVKDAQYQLNRDLVMQDWAYLNDWYYYLGIDPVEYGEELGWSSGGNSERYWQTWIDFNYHKVTMDDGLECFIVSFFSEPYINFEDY